MVTIVQMGRRTIRAVTVCCILVAAAIANARPRKPAPPLEPHVDVYAPRGELGGRQALDVLASVNARAAKLRACYERELQRSPNLEGKSMVALTVDVAGQVTASKITTRTNPIKDLDDCFLREIKAVAFAKGTKLATFTLPIEFSMGQAL